jgi:predicted negative regulator of RcsB-dependent stress response
MNIQPAGKGMPSKFIYSRILFFVAIFLLLIGGILFTWKTFVDEMANQKQEAILLAESAASQIPKSYLRALENNENDLSKVEYLNIKKALSVL